MTNEHETDIATLEQEARQMRARMNRQTEELESANKRANALAAVLIGPIAAALEHASENE